MTKVRVRIAPSPTGPFHVGSARSALFNYVFAKKHDGSFILRIEDTDLERSEKIYENDICEALGWLGLAWDEFYRQSERKEIYKEYLARLEKLGKIFWCKHPKDELTREREEQMQNKQAPRHICSFRNNSSEKTEGREEGILRFKNDEIDDISFQDIIRGSIRFNRALLGDFSIARSYDDVLYNFAATVDDSLMEISHVIRGEDHISNTPKQIMLAEALGLDAPKYAHLPLILGKDRSKISKRHGPVALSQYRKEGYLAEAMINFLALLGWHPSQTQISNIKPQKEDIFSLDYLIENFELEDVQKGGAVFDIDKLNWINGEYIRKKTADELADLLLNFLKPEWRSEISKSQITKRRWSKIVMLEQTRLSRLEEINSQVDYFFIRPFINKDELKWKNQTIAEVTENLAQLKAALLQIPDDNFNKDALEQKIMPFAKKIGTGELLWPTRFALSGKSASPGPFEIAEILGKIETIERIENALEIAKS